MGYQLSSFVQGLVSFRRMRVVHSDHPSSSPALTCTCREKNIMAYALVKFANYDDSQNCRQATTRNSLRTLMIVVVEQAIAVNNNLLSKYIHLNDHISPSYETKYWVQAIYIAMFCRARLPKIWFLLQQNEISLVSGIEGMKLSILKRSISGQFLTFMTSKKRE